VNLPNFIAAQQHKKKRGTHGGRSTSQHKQATETRKKKPPKKRPQKDKERENEGTNELGGRERESEEKKHTRCKW
jgi:hypothetical protein